jgi:hypothetical protein
VHIGQHSNHSFWENDAAWVEHGPAGISILQKKQGWERQNDCRIDSRWKGIHERIIESQPTHEMPKDFVQFFLI